MRSRDVVIADAGEYFENSEAQLKEYYDAAWESVGEEGAQNGRNAVFYYGMAVDIFNIMEEPTDITNYDMNELYEALPETPGIGKGQHDPTDSESESDSDSSNSDQFESSSDDDDEDEGRRRH